MVRSKMRMGAPGRRRAPYKRLTESDNDKVQRSIRLPKTIDDALDALAFSQDPPISFQAYVEMVLTQAVIEAGPIPERALLLKSRVAPALESSEPKAMSIIELSMKYEVTARTIQNWAHETTFPRPVDKRGKAFLYAESDVAAWALEHKGIQVTADGVFRNVSEPSKEEPPKVDVDVESLVTQVAELKQKLDALSKLHAPKEGPSP